MFRWALFQERAFLQEKLLLRLRMLITLALDFENLIPIL